LLALQMPVASVLVDVAEADEAAALVLLG